MANISDEDFAAEYLRRLRVRHDSDQLKLAADQVLVVERKRCSAWLQAIRRTFVDRSHDTVFSLLQRMLDSGEEAPSDEPR